MPRNLEVLEITTESVFISWSPPASDGGEVITDYRIQTEDQDTFEIVNRQHPAQPGVSNITFNITRLTPFSTYIIAVAAINSADRGLPVTTTVDTLSLS